MGQPKTIYVVTEGDYSDYSIRGLFSTDEKAKTFITNNKEEYTTPEIEEWLLDEREQDTIKTLWNCEMNAESGAITNEWKYTDSCCPHYTNVVFYSKTIRARSSVSQEHARKLAVEKRQEILRNG